MLRFITGTAGSGKTTLLRRQVCADVEAGERVIVVVPEQVSFETERSIYDVLGARKAMGVEVLSFTRLCNRIFREYGGLAGDYIDDSARLLLMSVTLEEWKDALRLYGNRSGRLQFVQALVSQISEFKNAGVTPDALEEFARSAGEGGLAEKTAELSVIFRAYQARLAQSYKDAEDDLMSACALLEVNPFFSGYRVYIDAFKSFTAGEYRLLTHIIAQSPSVTAALCTDSLEDCEHGMGLFSLVQKTAARLSRIARENRVPVETIAVLTQNHRTPHPDLRHLEQNLFRSAAAPYPGAAPHLRLVRAANLYDEAEYVAASICELVRERGLRYREVAVLSRDLDTYGPALENAFERYDIPCFFDRRDEISQKPLAAALLHAVEAVRRRFDTDEILALMKTSLLGLSAREIGELENYCFVWRVRGDAWLSGFTANPDGYGKLTSEGREALERINATRARVAGPLQKLSDGLRGCDGAGFAHAVYAYLGDSGILDGLRRAGEDDPVADDNAALYDAVVDLLDQFACALKGVRLTVGQFSELLRLTLSALDLGVLPQTLDQVTVGAVDRARLSAPKAVYLVGVNEGVFPAVYQPGGLFSDAERERMQEAGLEISDTAQSQAVDELFCAYAALCAPSEQVTVSWPESNLKGESLYPSAVVRAVRAALPMAETVEPQSLPRLFYIRNQKTAFDSFCAGLRRDDSLTASLAVWLGEQGLTDRVALLSHPVAPDRYRLADQETIDRLYGRSLNLSPSQLDQFHQCKMAYFCRYGLCILPRRRAELDPMQSGTVVHYVLQMLLSAHRDKQSLEALVGQRGALRREVRELLDAYIEQNMGGRTGKPARFDYLVKRLEDTLVALARHLAREFAQSDFVPAYFELPIRRGGGDTGKGAPAAEPMEFTLADGGRVRVEGVVDRVDVMEKNGKTYLRVVDYKTGSKEFDLTDVYNGLNLQMLLYLFTLRENGVESLDHPLPAGILYMPARTQFVAMERGQSERETEAEQEKNLRMNGLLLDDPLVIRGMEREGAGVYVPALIRRKEETVSGRGKNKVTRTVEEIKGDVATLAEFGRLERYIQRLVVQMGESLRAGEIAALPTYTKKYNNTCEYCAYRAVCGREEDGARLDADVIRDKDAFFQRLEEEEQAAGKEGSGDAGHPMDQGTTGGD
ncbi:exodeoxyribonuclease V subunit gamma [Clostridiaceae bacterium NSJ-31]|uniref:Exodeoxyribonuclease V subunit gamma n=1 Tax=Ligaoa zhengdingensis TaxID=2763658 RepID=A0A926I3N6_9FIRM|nr:PD-(D/E)XK nuclease family protein [Ligaoa zhengdingensis]MBC8545540.1 exodeoxyribonuclease V subunit gamma [Ligaoa zhengdingensis]